MSRGLMFVLAFDTLSAAQSVWLGRLLQGVPAQHSLLIIFSLVALFFIIVTIYARDPWPAFTRRRAALFISLNIGTLGTWVFLYQSLKSIEPAMTAAVLYGVNPLATLLISLFLTGSLRDFTLRRVIVSIATIASMWFVAHTVLEGNSSLGKQEASASLYGLLFAVLTGFSLALVNVISKHIYDQGYKLNQLMSTRFFLLIGACAFFANGLQTSISQYGLAFIAIALLGNVVPLYCLQKGIGLTAPGQVSYVLLATPIFVFVFQLFDSRLSLSADSIMAIVLVCLCALIGLRMEQSITKSNRSVSSK